ncbi:MAG: isoprenyl transferase [Rhodospirillaceae bacterium]|jgi:undecaprenyl diphosphate synthase|nr:isoprenyl transferase [Rhodospirillaceae bacterium]MBT3885375.1 isoprenyl transferase [Rhodospirillaceae bacterium]MBT4118780.1 isoprenyl transferase [Rhodospirillaceae bacterium]MBT4671492.1 isoprenyl transferase [Rhodospirillaceae bacterium]MBT4719881.1 isoprenyl transferase [Rhodospirillaceae bacterium]
MSLAPSLSDTGHSPNHVAIIMDGNGRWAQARGLPRIEGHRRGAQSVRTAVECSVKFGIRYLTLYSFSSENWKRPAREVQDLMGLLRRYLLSEIADLHKNGVRLRVIGDREDLSADIVKLIEEGEAFTAGNDKLDLIVALSYGGRSEIISAIQKIAKKVEAGQLTSGAIDERVLEAHLETADIPDPDLLIRTSGEQRISNFLLWQIAYSELVFMDTLWPDFSEKDFLMAINEYQRRERRFGATA